jgi:type II secretory pathway pseudopilin PulG
VRSKRWSPLKPRGFTYIEALAALMMTAMLMVGLTRTLSNVLESSDETRASHNAVEESRYVLERIVRAVSRSQRLLVPLAENPLTAHTESIRDPGVLAVTLDPTRDLDADGSADADVDRDGRIDEDLDNDTTADGQPGIMGIDDDGDGSVDEGSQEDDDEDGLLNEDPIDGIDNDGDGSIDEDSNSDMNGDGADGIAGFDDDGDGLIDEDIPPNDDEDGLRDEDGWDALVFYQSGADLVERTPVPWNENGSGGVDGEDWIERIIATDVLQFYVERIPAPNGGSPLLNVLLTRSDADGQPHTLQTTIRLGGGP